MKVAYKSSELQRERATKYYWENRQKKLGYAREYREQHRDKVRQYLRTDAAKQRKNALRRAWNAENRDRQIATNQKAHLKRYHGLTVEQYAAMVEAQDGKCAICQRTPDGKGHCGRLHVDHDHERRVIRELLCANCNRALGLFADTPEWMVAAAAYVERHRRSEDRSPAGDDVVLLDGLGL